MLLVAVAALAVVSVVVARGRLSALAAIPLRGTSLIAIALGAQVLVVSVIPDLVDEAGPTVHLATYGLIAAFVWLNRRIAGVAVVAAGAALNAVAIAANGGVMPASPGALAAAGIPAGKPGEFANSALVEGSALSFLGDVFAVPASWPLSNVFSIGDILIAVGLILGLHCLSRSVPAVAAGRLFRRVAR
jgi:hypothetical protein